MCGRVSSAVRVYIYTYILYIYIHTTYTYPGDSPSARILPAEFKGGPGIVFGKDQCDRFAGLPHGRPGWALPAALFAPINLKRSILARLLFYIPHLSLSPPLFPSRSHLHELTRLGAFCPRSARRLARLRQEDNRRALGELHETCRISFYREKLKIITEDLRDEIGERRNSTTALRSN